MNKTNARNWVNDYAGYLYSYAYKRVGDEEAARKLVQETFLGALENISSFEQRSSEKTRLTSILCHKIVDAYRKRARQKPMQLGQVDYFEENGFWK